MEATPITVFRLAELTLVSGAVPDPMTCQTAGTGSLGWPAPPLPCKHSTPGHTDHPQEATTLVRVKESQTRLAELPALEEAWAPFPGLP